MYLELTNQYDLYNLTTQNGVRVRKEMLVDDVIESPILDNRNKEYDFVDIFVDTISSDHNVASLNVYIWYSQDGTTFAEEDKHLILSVNKTYDVVISEERMAACALFVQLPRSYFKIVCENNGVTENVFVDFYIWKYVTTIIE